jgi:hypothetical protein
MTPLKFNSEKVEISNMRNIYGKYGKYIYTVYTAYICVYGIPIYGLGQPYIYGVYIRFWPTQLNSDIIRCGKAEEHVHKDVEFLPCLAASVLCYC